MAREMQANGEAADRRQTMPAGLRYALLAGLAALLASALYLIAVRGEALLADLSSLSQRILMCF
jgi:hypothetical protein